MSDASATICSAVSLSSSTNRASLLAPRVRGQWKCISRLGGNWGIAAKAYRVAWRASCTPSSISVWSACIGAHAVGKPTRSVIQFSPPRNRSRAASLSAIKPQTHKTETLFPCIAAHRRCCECLCKLLNVAVVYIHCLDAPHSYPGERVSLDAQPSDSLVQIDLACMPTVLCQQYFYFAWAGKVLRHSDGWSGRPHRAYTVPT